MSGPEQPELKLTAAETLRILRSSPELLDMEATYGPGGSPPPAHWHPTQHEHFEVLEGAVQVKVDGSDRSMDRGETLDVPPGTVHQMWNPAPTAATVRWQVREPGRTLEWFQAVDRLQRSVGDRQPGPLQFAPLLAEFDDVFRLPGPRLVTRPLVSLLGVAGRVLGNGPPR